MASLCLIDLITTFALAPFIPTAGLLYLLIKYLKYDVVFVEYWPEAAMINILVKYLNWLITLALSLILTIPQSGN